MKDVRIKICGLKSPEDVRAAAEASATYAGLVFFEKSPRHVSLDQAREISLAAPEGLAKVALTVDADNAHLDAILEHVPLDMLQLHGQESPERVMELKTRYGLPVIKAVGVASDADLAKVEHYAKVADQLLLDAKPPVGGDLPGGNGLSFDWRLVAGRRWGVPWMLAGGLTPENVGEAIRLTGAQQVDVSSGVEVNKGVKDHALIRAFVDACR